MSKNPENDPHSDRCVDAMSPLVVEVIDPATGDTFLCGAVTTVCPDPNCPCRDVVIALVRLDRDLREPPEIAGRISLNVDTLKFDLGDPRPDGLVINERFSEHELNLIAQALESHVPEFVERFNRGKVQPRADEWREQDWSRIPIDTMVRYYEAFPSSFDLGVEFDNIFYGLIDHWCLKPKCSCHTLAIEVVDKNECNSWKLEVSTKNWKLVSVEGEPRLRSIWNAFWSVERNRQELARRKDDMQRVRKELPALIAEQNPPGRRESKKVGRNDPCPCGSGKKYKKCCG